MPCTSRLRPLARTWLALLSLSLMAAAATAASETATPVVEALWSGPGTRLWEVQVDPAAAGDIRRSLADAGATVVAFLAPDRWLVAGAADELGGSVEADSFRAWRASEAVAPSLRSAAAGIDQRREAVVGVVVGLAPAADLVEVGDRLAKAGAEVVWSLTEVTPVPQLGLLVQRAALDEVVSALEATPDLAWADVQPPVRLRNSASVWRCQSGGLRTTPVFDHGLHGEGQVIGIMDTGLDLDDCRFDDPVVGLPAINGPQGTEVEPEHRKVLAVDFHWIGDWPPGDASWDDQGHGTHVAGSAAGDGLGNGTHDGVDGMAPAARLVIQDGGAVIDDCADLPGLGCPVKPLEPVLEQARAQGARIHSNSWGDEENLLPFGRYTERTADVDRFMWTHKDTLVLFAAGNAGPGFGTVGSPATAKNVVAVGATIHGDLDPTCAAPFSSRGWTRDGRIKPDLLAPGTQIVSAATDGFVPSPSCDDSVKSGTSMAAPTAAGLGALVRQYFTDGFHPTGRARSGDGFEPTAALVKAVLIASAVDLATLGCRHEPVPSHEQGWGLIRLDTALSFAGDRRRLLVDDHRQGFASADAEPNLLEIAVMEPGPLKVVLVWTDAPSSSLAMVNLVNDLDLTLRGPGGEFHGNVFFEGASVPGGLYDRTNNVEVVYLPEAEKGYWSIEIAPHAVPAAEQDYALVITGAVRRAPGPRQSSGRVAP